MSSSSAAPHRARRLSLAVGALTLSAALGLSGCTGDTGDTIAPSPDPSAASPSPTRTATQPPTYTAKQRAALLAGPASDRPLDATYRLRTRGERQPNPKVRVRTERKKYRIDIQTGRRTASLITTRKGLVSCQREPRGQTCLLVAKPGERPPRLFNPGVQRLFIRTDALVAAEAKRLTVKDAGRWRAPGDIGRATCFRLSGAKVDPGRYCFLSEGRFRGALVLVEFRSGTLRLLEIDGRPGPNAFTAPMKPRRLPG